MAQWKTNLSKATRLSPADALLKLSEFYFQAIPKFFRENTVQSNVDLQIIVPVYNVEKYLEDCIQSMLSQRTSFSYQVVFVDDGSTDHSGEILDKYKTGFPLYSNQTALNYLKKIGEKAGITRLHNVTEDRGGEVTTKQVPAYELIGTHTARRSFVSNMLQRGYDASIIMRITGHNDIESFQKYVKITSDDAANVILKKESGKVLSETKKESTEQKVTAQDVNNFVAIIDTVKQTYNEDIKKQKAEQKMEDASSILISLAEDDIDAHSIAKAIERTGLEVSLSDSATSRNFILRKDTKKKKIKFEEIDESE